MMDVHADSKQGNGHLTGSRQRHAEALVPPSATGIDENEYELTDA